VTVGKKKILLLLNFKKKITMVIPVFRGSKDEDLEVFLREYKRVCICTGLRITTKWLNFFPEFLEGATSHWFE